MKTSNCYSELLQQFPEYMTKNQMYKVCHISKKTCLFLLENGLVPCIDSGKKTRRFKIETNAVVHYLEDRELRPELYRPPQGFYKKKQSELNRALTEDDLLIMRQFYEAALKRYPDVLTTKQVSEFTGYGESSVVRWCSKQQLKIFYIKRRLFIPKEYLIDFLVYYIVLTYPDAAGKRKNKWISTKLPVKGNKKKAEKLLMEVRQTFVPPEKPLDNDIKFSDYMLQWLEIVKPTIATTTYASYSFIVKSVVVPYFKKADTTLCGLKALDIQTFYLEQLKKVSASTVIHYHTLLHRALKYAVKIELIEVNPADKVDRPKANRFVGSFYDSDEVQELFKAAKGSKLEIPIFLGAFYGLRRSEAIGLKWDAIDFQNNTITIRHTITSCCIDGKKVQEARDTTKTKSSMRTLPLVPVFKDLLLEKKKQQAEYRRVCGRSYDKRYLDYICVDEMGTLISPNYLTDTFPKLLEKNGLRRIRYHDLRHSCASLLLANGVPMKQIQEWLGHSDFSTTANVYAHLDFNSKLSSADAMVNGLQGALSVIS